MNKIKKPLNKGIAKTPVVMQLEMLECGAASLAMVLAYYDKWIPLEIVRSDCGISRDGSNAKSILKAARYYGLIAKGYQMEPEALIKEGTFPCIIHWNFNHFVVLKGFKNKYAYINDPAIGEVKVPLKEFDEAFTGICLAFEPGEDFVPSGKRQSTWQYISARTKGASIAIAIIILTTIITNLTSIIQPGLTRVFYDRLLTGINKEWTNPFLLCLALLYFIEIVLDLLRITYNQKINGKLAAVSSTSFMWKALRLPMEFYSQRMVGDVLTRKNSNGQIANAIVNTLAPLLLNAVMMIFYFVVMLRYNVVLTIVSLIAIASNTIVSQIISKKRINITRSSLRDSGKLYSTTVAGISMIETIKASGSENGFFARWAGYQAKQSDGENQFSAINYTLGLIPTIISMLTSTTILGLGLYLTIQGEFTLGMITAFQGYLTNFMSPATTLINASQTLQEMRTEIERVDDVMNYPIDPICNFNSIKQDNYAKLTGNIEIRNVTFGYSKLDEPLIKDFSFTIHQGDKIAIVGESGCGKSTIAKLISGINQPWSGEILFDGKKQSEIDRSIFTGSLAVVDQDIIIFEDTIKNNIKMWDNSIEDFEVILAARDAQIHDDILLRENGYDYILTEGGKDFSGGQRQRLEIARVLAQDPTIVILDEATSALDAKTENEVVNAINARGITCIVVAHRLSTIRDCDQIIVLDHGNVVEIGTHDELYKLNGYYTRLVSND